MNAKQIATHDVWNGEQWLGQIVMEDDIDYSCLGHHFDSVEFGWTSATPTSWPNSLTRRRTYEGSLYDSNDAEFAGFGEGWS